MKKIYVKPETVLVCITDEYNLLAGSLKMKREYGFGADEIKEESNSKQDEGNIELWNDGEGEIWSL